LGVLPDVSSALGLRLTQPGNRIVFIGAFSGNLGGSEVARILGQTEKGRAPEADFALERNMARAIVQLAESRSVCAAHDISSGGIFVAAAEMMLGAWGRVDLGLDPDLSSLPAEGDLALLFSEMGGYLVEVQGTLPDPIQNLPHAILGTVTSEKSLRIRGKSGSWEWTASELESAWGSSFAKAVE
jgi:phosphoribosylformylglycinamidine (FGAM) synthase-like enzyme